MPALISTVQESVMSTTTFKIHNELQTTDYRLYALPLYRVIIDMPSSTPAILYTLAVNVHVSHPPRPNRDHIHITSACTALS